MRRGIGVAYTQNNAAKQKQMADLGETLAAERIGSITNDLDALTSQLQKLAEQHKDRVKQDPILRARFRQLAQSLGADILSSRENLFSKQSGLDDFYVALASEVVHVCMQESAFTGPLVPMKNVLAALRRMRGSSASTEITEDDVIAALGRMSILGGEYATVELGSETYINTVSTASGGSSSASKKGAAVQATDVDVILSTAAAVLQSRRRKLDGSEEKDKEHRRAIASYSFRSHQPQRLSVMASEANNDKPTTSSSAPLPTPSDFYPCLTLSELRESLPPLFSQQGAIRRVEIALQELIKSGQVWVDVDPMHVSTKGSLVAGMCEPAKGKTAPSNPQAITSGAGPYYYTSSGSGAIGSADDGFEVVSTSSTGRVTVQSYKGPSSADVLEHAAVKYWFVAFL